MQTPLTPRAIARTYSHRSYTDPWEAVEDYRRVRAYAADHPDAGRVRVGNALDLPPSRVRSWLAGSKPDPLRAIEVGSERNWFEAELESETFAAFNVLVASVLSGGSISGRDLKVSFNARKGEGVLDALDTVRVGWTTRHADSAERPTEILPSEHGAVLARALTILGAPRGDKAAATYYLPPYLSGAPDAVRETFARVYLRNCAGRATREDTVRLREVRSKTFARQLREFLAQTLDVPVEGSGRTLTFPPGTLADIDARGVEPTA